MEKGTDVQHAMPEEKGEYIEQNERVDHHTNGRSEAVTAENLEHSMTMIEAVKAYPMACFWAFVVSFTIVSGV
jgi:SP family general alpha glucoside:H+ symporter-like MFS transporter